MQGSMVATSTAMMMLGGNARNGSVLSSDPVRAQQAVSIARSTTVFSYSSYSTEDVPISGTDNIQNRLSATGQSCDYDEQSDRVYCFGGVTIGGKSMLLAGLAVLSPTDLRWYGNAAVDIPERWGHASTILNGVLYIFGGWTASQGGGGDFWSVNLQSFAARALGFTGLYAPTPPARQYACLVPLSATSLLLVGGEWNGQILGDYWMYDIPHDRWVDASGWFNDESPGPRTGLSCATVNSQVWVFGGRNELGEMTNDVWSLDPKRWAWKHRAGIKAPDDGRNSTLGSVPPPAGVGNRTNVTAPATATHALPVASTTVKLIPSIQPTPGKPLVARSRFRRAPAPVATVTVGQPSPRAYQLSTSIGQFLVIHGGATAPGAAGGELLALDRLIYFFDTNSAAWVPETSALGTLAIYKQTFPPDGLSKTALILIVVFTIFGAAVLVAGVVFLILHLRKRKRAMEERQASLQRKLPLGLGCEFGDPKDATVQDVFRMSTLYASSREVDSETYPLPQVSKPRSSMRKGRTPHPRNEDQSLLWSSSSERDSASTLQDTSLAKEKNLLDQTSGGFQRSPERLCLPPLSPVPPAYRAAKAPRPSFNHRRSPVQEERHQSVDPKRLTLGSVFGSGGDIRTSRTSRASRGSKKSDGPMSYRDT
ncbi:hypothetical protein DFS34DRAFT_647649 [Phlyctochytrium arcticum]|nr:hypothetical protein DFS34DRAFT_647649 [Phlyctochytrium arcticum]